MHRNITKSEASLFVIYILQSIVKKAELIEILINYLENVVVYGIHV